MNQNERIELDKLVLDAAKNTFENDYKEWLSAFYFALDMVLYDDDLKDYGIIDIENSIIRQRLLERTNPEGLMIIKLHE